MIVTTKLKQIDSPQIHNTTLQLYPIRASCQHKVHVLLLQCYTKKQGTNFLIAATAGQPIYWDVILERIPCQYHRADLISL
jgi:hypothetical protein